MDPTPRSRLRKATAMRRASWWTAIIMASALLCEGHRTCAAEEAPTLQQQLAKEDPAALAKAAREQGDAVRGAVVFYRPDRACIRCHTTGEADSRLGPDLAKAGKEASDVYLLESVLLPSKVIKKGYETVTITTKAGRTFTGL